jgi:hypothetical protein
MARPRKNSSPDRRAASKARLDAGRRILRIEVDVLDTIEALRATRLLPAAAYAGAEPTWQEVEQAAAIFWQHAVIDGVED